MQAHLAPRPAGRHQRQEEQLAAIVRGAAMPGCVMVGVGASAADTIRAALGNRLHQETGGVLLGSSWTGAEVRLLPPLGGVSEHAPVLVKLPL